MTNLEWLEKVREKDIRETKEARKNGYSFLECLNIKELKHRQVVALEIIAESFCKLNKTANEIKKYDILVKYGHEQERTETGDWEVRVKKDEKEANE